MPWGIAAAAVGSIAGSVIQGNAASNAAQDQENAAENATQAQLQMFNTTQGDYKNQIALGGGASQLLENLFGTNNGGKGTPNYSAFDNSPGYKFSVQQGDTAIDRAAASSGGLYSTNTLGALSSYNTGVASTQYNSYVNQLLSMAGLGNAAASGVGAAATATGGEIGSNMNLAGSAAAAGTLGQANAFSNLLGSNTGFGSLLAGYANGGGANAFNENAGGGGGVGYNAAGQQGLYDSSGNLMYSDLT
jgi:hypothetical protein